MRSLCGNSGPEKSKAMQEGTRVYTVKVNSLSKGHREWKIQERRLRAIEAVLHLWVASLNMRRSLFKLAANQQSPNVSGGGRGESAQIWCRMAFQNGHPKSSMGAVCKRTTRN